MPIRDPKPKATGGVRVSRKDADEVFMATATEPGRNHQSSKNLHPARAEKIRQKAEEIVERGKNKHGKS
jgi:hypothetical protein